MLDILFSVGQFVSWLEIKRGDLQYIVLINPHFPYVMSKIVLGNDIIEI